MKVPYPSYAQSATVFNPYISTNSQSQSGLYGQFNGVTSGDPIDMVKGHFLYEHDDINVGVGNFPSSLNFQRLYSSGLSTRDGTLGKGWTHNLNRSLRVSSDGYQGLGEDSALDAVHALVEMKASHDLFMDTAAPVEKIVIGAIVQNWLADRLVNNTVVVNQGLNAEVFVKLPDGTFNPPPGNAAKLMPGANGTYQLRVQPVDATP
ncbi:hypothetical protein D9M69_189790 [compost metagenome]